MEKIIQLLSYITTDMMEPIGYIPWGVIFGCLYLLVLKLYRKIHGHSSSTSTFRADILHFLLIMYGVILIKLAFFSREPGSRTDVSIRLMETWGTTMQAHAFFVENILMFIPFGILVPVTYRKMRHFIPCVAAAFLCSILLEGLQLITGRGYCQLDDIITNTIGGTVGYIIYASLRFINDGI